jgi:hypothetical protein
MNMASTELDWNETPFTREVYDVSVEWERLGWLHKYQDQHGREWWVANAIGPPYARSAPAGAPEAVKIANLRGIAREGELATFLTKRNRP